MGKELPILPSSAQPATPEQAERFVYSRVFCQKENSPPLRLLIEFLKARGQTPIVPVVLDGEIDVCRFARALLEAGIYVNPVLRPAASRNLLRISCTAAHQESHVERLVETMTRTAQKLGIGLPAACAANA